MNTNQMIALVLENIALLAIGGMLVLGFYYHSTFYAIYTPILYIAGSAMIVLMIWTVVMIRSKKDYLTKTDGVIIFDPNEKEKVLNGIKKTKIFDRRLKNYTKDYRYNAKIIILSKWLKSHRDYLDCFT